MTRFAERIEHDLRQIADQASPSSTAWEAIQHRVAEPAGQPTVEVIMLAPNDPPNTRRRLVQLVAAAAVALLAVVGGTMLANRGGGEPDNVVVADPSPTEEASAPAPTVEADVNPDPDVEPAELLIGVEQTPIEGGVLHKTDVLGLRMSLELDDQFDVVRVARPGEFQLADGDVCVGCTFNRIVAGARVGGWYTREESVDLDYLGAGSIGPLDIDGWVANNEVLAEQRPDTIVSGRPAVVYDIRLNPFSDAKFDENCDGPCQFMFSVAEESLDPATARGDFRWWNQEARMRIFVIGIDGHDPLVVFAVAAGLNAEASVAWFDEFEETVLPTIELGPDGPSMPRS